MTDLHPLTEEILEHVDGKNDFVDTEAIDRAVRERLDPKTFEVASGVRFPDEAPDANVTVSANFRTVGGQLQQLFVGFEPVMIVQPEFDADDNEISLVVTAVALDPKGLLHILEILKDATEEMVSQQVADEERAQHEATQESAEEAVGEVVTGEIVES